MIKDKLEKIKYSRLTESDKLLINIFNNLTKIVNTKGVDYVYNNKIVIKYTTITNTILYDNDTIGIPLEDMGLTIEETIKIVEKYVKKYLKYENVLAWRFNVHKNIDYKWNII